jgi:hypothetical protein
MTKSKGSKLIGVYKKDGLYNAYIYDESRQYIHIGVFKTEKEAAVAYNNKAQQLFGMYCQLNTLV